MAAKLYKGRKKAKWNGLSEIQENKLIELILSSDIFWSSGVWLPITDKKLFFILMLQ